MVVKQAGCLMGVMLLGVLAACDDGVSQAPGDSRADVPRSPEAGSTAVLVGPSGGTYTFFGGKLKLEVPPGALSKETPIGAQIPKSYPASALLVQDTVYDLLPDGIKFSKAVKLSIKYDRDKVPPTVAEAALRVYKVVSSVWKLVPGGGVDAKGNVAWAMLNSFSKYGVKGTGPATGDAGPEAGQPDAGLPDKAQPGDLPKPLDQTQPPDLQPPPDLPPPDAGILDAPVPDAPQAVAAPQITAPTACQVLFTTTSAVLNFTVASLTGIDKFTLDVKEVSGCNQQPTGGSVGGYPVTGSAVSPKTYTLQLLSPGKWYKYSVESTAKAGWVSSNTVGWFQTAALQPDVGAPDLAPPDAGVPDAVSPDAGANKDWGTVVPGTWTTIPGGTFQMGSPASESCRKSTETLHQVTLTHKFKIQAKEVTQAQFKSLMGYNPSYFIYCGGTCPVEQVSWHEAAAYANALSAQAGKTACYACTGSGKSVTCSEATAYAGQKVYTCPGYRLPTEAEWEFAYRAGTSTAFYNGGIWWCSNPDPNLDKIGWYKENSKVKYPGDLLLRGTHPVGGKVPNAWGLYDMAGNVQEWCHDWFSGYTGSARVMRGGFWFSDARHCRAAARFGYNPGLRDSSAGFRLARSIL